MNIKGISTKPNAKSSRRTGGQTQAYSNSTYHYGPVTPTVGCLSSHQSRNTTVTQGAQYPDLCFDYYPKNSPQRYHNTSGRGDQEQQARNPNYGRLEPAENREPADLCLLAGQAAKDARRSGRPTRLEMPLNGSLYGRNLNPTLIKHQRPQHPLADTGPKSSPRYLPTHESKHDLYYSPYAHEGVSESEREAARRTSHAPLKKTLRLAEAASRESHSSMRRFESFKAGTQHIERRIRNEVNMDGSAALQKSSLEGIFETLDEYRVDSSPFLQYT